MRDLLILQHVHDCRLAGNQDQADPFKASGSALLLATALNRWAPPRVRLSDSDIYNMLQQGELMTKRQLLKAVHQGWRMLGKRRPRGAKFASLRQVKLWLEFAVEIAQSINDGRLQVENSTLAELSDTLMDLFEELGGKVAR